MAAYGENLMATHTIRCSLRGERTIAHSDARSSSLILIPTVTSGMIASTLARAECAAHASSFVSSTGWRVLLVDRR
jgi:hypothetical protein